MLLPIQIENEKIGEKRILRPFEKKKLEKYTKKSFFNNIKLFGRNSFEYSILPDGVVFQHNTDTVL
jgi:hypothetical protein